MPGAVPDSFGEFFLVQYREKGNGNDPLSGGPGKAVWIWHVDSTLIGDGWSFLYDNSYTAHKLLRLMEADGLEEIEAGNGYWDINDFYVPGKGLGPGNGTRFQELYRFDNERFCYEYSTTSFIDADGVQYTFFRTVCDLQRNTPLRFCTTRCDVYGYFHGYFDHEPALGFR